MNTLLGLLLISAAVTGLAIIPSIHLLYRLHFRTPEYESKDLLGRLSLFNVFHGWKKGTPTGVGILMLVVYVLMYGAWYVFFENAITWVGWAMLSAGIGFGLLGLYDDITKFFQLHKGAWGLQTRHKFVLQWILGLAIGYLLYTHGGLVSIGPLHVGGMFVVIAAFVIVSMSNAFNITDGMDGLSSGLLLMTLAGFWVIMPEWLYEAQVGIAILIGVILPYLYFNIYPARVLMGDSGALAFGALIGVLALISDTVLVLPVIAGVFIAEMLSSLVQVLSFRLRGGKRIFLIAPLHHHLEALGWPETKVTMRLWLAGAVLTLIGIGIALFPL